MGGTYRLVSEPSPEKLEVVVNSMLNDGWECSAPPFYGEGYFVQPMTRGTK